MPKSTKALEAIAALKQLRSAPSVVIPGKLTELEKAALESKGKYGAQRVQRAADEIKNLEQQYTLDALRGAFLGDNAKALMVGKPAEFQRFAARLEEPYRPAVERYWWEMSPQGGGAQDVPFLDINRKSPEWLPQITGHEGRHRNIAMDELGHESTLWRLLPSRDLRESMPRRSQEQFIEALRQELGLNRFVTPEGRSLLPTDLSSPEHQNLERRGLTAGNRPVLPEPFSGGGKVKRRDIDEFKLLGEDEAARARPFDTGYRKPEPKQTPMEKLDAALKQQGSFAAPRPRATTVSQFEKDFRDYVANQQAARQQLMSDLVSPSRIANAAVPGAVGALTGYGSQMLGGVGDIVGLYEEFKPESWASAPTSLQSLPSTEQVQELFAPKADSFIGRRMPEYEAGITGGNLYALGEAAYRLPSFVRGVGRGAKALGKEAGRRIDEAMMTGEGMLGSALAPARPNFIKETGGKGRYETRQEGPFYRVTQRKTEKAGSGDREIRSEIRSPDIAGGSGRGNVPQPISDEAIGLLIKDPSNFVSRAANAYTQGVAGRGYGLPEMPESSLAKQSAIGRVFQLAASGDNAYKQAVFEAYGRRYPKLVESTGAQNYDQLMEAAYRQLAKETADQFHTLPISMSYHKRGEGNYQNSGELLRDIYGNRHMYVYQGGDPHDFLNAVDPETGLNTNEMFRAVHDFYGHATHGNAFGPKGEEIAYGAHSQMYSPLARMAMAGETRGQNSFVNYTPINAELKQRINRLNEAKFEAERRGQSADVDELNKELSIAWQDFQFAPQKSVLLPPEFLETSYTGGMPSWVSPLIVPDPGTTTSQILTHYSHSPDLTFLDPKRYGTGIKGAEASRLRSVENPVMERSYFYTGDPALVRPEKGLGSHRYGAMGEGLYDLTADPLLFRPLAVEANRVPWTSQVNRGVVRAPQAEADVERLIKEYGYSGMANPDLGMAIMYDKTPVSPFAQGGTVSQDAMRMKAWDKQVQGKAAGGLTKVGKGIGKAIDVVTELKEAPKAGVFKPKRVQTVSEPQRMAFPGIYQRPDVIASEAASRVAPEDPALKQIFGVTREDLYQLGKSRQGNLPGELPGQAANPRGSAAAEAVMTRRNRQRILDVNAEAEKHPLLVQGMDPWYVMDPLYKRMVQLLGPEQANIEYRKMNTLMGMASPGSEVLDEIPRGTAAYFLQKQGRFPEFIEHLGKKQNERGDVPLDIINVPGHIYHQTAQAIPMGRYLETGELQMKSPKVPMYIEASQVPEIGFQTRTPVGDAHWSRAVGLADTRGARTIKGKEAVPGASVSNPEMAQLAPWWREQIAKELGIESVPAQARTWGVFSGQTGVTTPIGAPKLELLAQKIMETAERLGVSPETARDMVITGQTYAGKKDGGAVHMAEGGMTSDDLIVEERPL